MTTEQTTQRKKIEMDRVNLTQFEVLVSTECTGFADERRYPRTTDTVMNEYKSLLRLAKKSGVKTVYKKRISRQLKELEADVNQALVRHNELFDELLSGWRAKVDDVYYGYGEDKEIERLCDIRNALSATCNRSTPLGKLAEIHHHILQSRRNIETDSTTKIFI